MSHRLTGFGFGPIQAGLFVKEAHDTGSFDRLVVAEIDPCLVHAVRANDQSYAVNVAHADGIEVVRVCGVELLNPTCTQDLQELQAALAQSTEIVTALPTVDLFDQGEPSIARLIATCLNTGSSDGVLVYTAENHNHAAEILQARVEHYTAAPGTPVQFLNTVVGKMSRVVTDPGEIRARDLCPIAPGIERAFLVEAFNHILVTQCALKGVTPGITVFEQKPDLMPFEEAKLYGHNAIHALTAYLGALRQRTSMAELTRDKDIMSVALAAFLSESGAALIKKYVGLGDALFTAAGYRQFALDLLERMGNPHLGDTIERAARDPLRKLQYQDRLFGTLRLALDQGIEAPNMALGAAAALDYLLARAEQYAIPLGLCPAARESMDAEQIKSLLIWIWQGEQYADLEALARPVLQAWPQLERFRM
jgi:mannitol-1-phosphate/altronate dehydrogenase